MNDSYDSYIKGLFLFVFLALQPIVSIFAAP